MKAGFSGKEIEMVLGKKILRTIDQGWGDSKINRIYSKEERRNSPRDSAVGIGGNGSLIQLLFN